MWAVLLERWVAYGDVIPSASIPLSFCVFLPTSVSLQPPISLVFFNVEENGYLFVVFDVLHLLRSWRQGIYNGVPKYGDSVLPIQRRQSTSEDVKKKNNSPHGETVAHSEEENDNLEVSHEEMGDEPDEVEDSIDSPLSTLSNSEVSIHEQEVVILFIKITFSQIYY